DGQPIRDERDDDRREHEEGDRLVAQVWTGEPGPRGIPSRYQATKKSVHAIERTTTYGSISETTVPIPASFLYFCANTTISGKYAISGVITLNGESPTRYAASTVCGATPRRMNSGTKIGASSAHLAIAAGMIRSTMNVTMISPISSHTAPMFMLSSTS